MPLPLKPFYLLRHGETEMNAQKIIAGHTDTVLTNKGIDQASAVGEWIDRLDIMPSCIVRSDLIRTKDTADLVNKKLALNINVEDQLRERNFGDWSGKPKEFVWQKTQIGETPPDGESMEMFINRVKGVLTHILNTYSENPLLVAHGGIFRVFGKLYGTSKFDSKNCELHYFKPTHNSSVPWDITKYSYESGVVEAEQITL